jgi:hypothetical protein
MKNDLRKVEGKEGPLKGLREKIRDSVKFEEKYPLKGLKNKQSNFKDMRRWDAELEKLDREELSLKNSLKEINSRINEVIHKREVGKSLSQVTLIKETNDKKKIDYSLNKISKAVNRNRSEKRRDLLMNS